MTTINEKAVIRKIFWRVIPLIMILYIISYIDRINVGFASLTMNDDIGLSPYIYGWGAGIFFLGYCLFEVPSNLLLEKFGARRWIARIVFTWGIISCSMALVQGPSSFIALRFLLGVAEAGFFPGVVLYLTYWFPSKYRARIVATFSLAIPASIAVGAPLSTALLHMDGILGLHGWQWLFLVEGMPALIGTFFVLRWLTDNPADATWLSTEEKLWLQSEIFKDAPAVTSESSVISQVFANPTILVLAAIYFGAVSANLGLSFFLPQIIKGQGYDTIYVGFITSIPYVVGCIGMVIIGYSSDFFKERRWHLSVTMAIAATGLTIAGLNSASTLAIAALSFAAIGILGCKGPFWALPSAFFSGSAAAGGIALINSLGNLGGFVGPFVVGYLRNQSGGFSTGLFALAILGLAATVMAIFLPRRSR